MPCPPVDSAQPPPAAIAKHLLAILALPFNVTVVIPAVLIWRFGLDTCHFWTTQPITRILLTAVGGLMLLLGLALMFQTIRLFARQGRGTLAPWTPTQRLVVAGPYRYVRNPMISGVTALLLGETLTAASPWLAGWTLFFWLINAVYIPWVEEPGLHQRFGEDYARFHQNVPRWIPRLSPWTPPPAEKSA